MNPKHAWVSRAAVIATVAAWSLAGARAAEPTTAERDGWPADTRGTIPKMTQPPTLDGKIRAAEWHEASEFNAQVSQIGKHNFYPRSVIWHLGWDEQHIYLASRTPLLPNERPKRLARVPVGSTVMFDDTIELWLDPKGRNAGKEMASYFQAMVNCLGITYYCRLFPQVAARSDDWRPDWKIATSVDEKHMDIEIAMPIKDFLLEQPNRPGDVWGMNLARNFMFQNWNQSPMAYQFPGFGFAVHTAYPRMTLQAAQPYVKFHHPRALYEGRAFASAEILNPTDQPQSVKARLAITDRDGKTTLFAKEETLTIAAKGATTWRVDEAATPPIDPAVTNLYRYAFTVTAATGAPEYFHVHFAYDPTESRAWLTREFAPPPQLTATASFNPVRSRLETSVDVIDFTRKAEATAARTVVRDAAGKTVADAKSTRFYRDLYRDLVQLPVLAPGKYRWESSIVLKDGSELAAGTGEFEKKDESAAFAWWNTPLGNGEKVLWPYAAVAAESRGAVLKAWGKEYRLNKLALPEQILSTGNTDRWPKDRTGAPEILAAPCRLRVTAGGKTADVPAAGRPAVEAKADHRVTVTGEGELDGLRVTTRCRLEQDGAYFVELTLAAAKPGASKVVEAVDLEIPVRAALADFLNAYAHCGYSGYFIDWLPQAKDPAAPRSSVWNPSLCGPSSVTVGDFIPQIWIGNEFRGLLWYADNDRGWTPVEGQHAQEIVREGDAAVLVHHLISTPTDVSQPRTIRFVLQATPIRPLVPGWRMTSADFTQSFLPWDAMGRNSAHYSAMINLPGPANYAKSKEFAAKWPGPKAPKPNLARYFAPHTESSAIMTSVWGDRNYFGGEWENGTYNQTLIDHTLWWVNKWIDEGGLQGLYHDQFSPHRIGSVSSDLAYFLDDGRVQPGFALTTRRQYCLRQHALWLEKGINPPRTLTHATNGGPLGSVGWVETFLDGEDKLINKAMGDVDFADTWSGDRLRAGSIAYNMGVTFAWMRLIDTVGMSKEEIDHHARVYAGHTFLHDVMNAYMVVSNPRASESLPPLSWGMNDDRVLFWPYWRNADVVSVNNPEVKVSVWTLPDRLLLCAFNYSKTRAADCTVSLDLARLGVKLPAGAAVADIEKPGVAVGGAAAKGEVKVVIGTRDYALIALAVPAP